MKQQPTALEEIAVGFMSGILMALMDITQSPLLSVSVCLICVSLWKIIRIFMPLLQKHCAPLAYKIFASALHLAGIQNTN